MCVCAAGSEEEERAKRRGSLRLPGWWRGLQEVDASLHVWSLLSGGQEMPTVSAVSLTANEFPAGGDNVFWVCVWVCVCFGGVRTSWNGD